MEITQAGQTLLHFPQPIQVFSSTMAMIPCEMVMAFLGQTPTQVPQATHWGSTIARFFIEILLKYISILAVTNINEEMQFVKEKGNEFEKRPARTHGMGKMLRGVKLYDIVNKE